MKNGRIYLYTFFLTLGEALLFSLLSPYIVKMAGTDLVGMVYALSSLGALIMLLVLPFFLSRLGAHKLLTTLLIVAITSCLIIALGPTAYITGAIIIFLLLPQVLPAITDIFLERGTKSSERGSAFGLEFSVINLAFCIGPFIAGFVISRSGYSTMFLLSGLMYFLALVVAFSLWRGRRPAYKHGNTIHTIAKAIFDPNLRLALVLTLLLQLFFAFMVIYTPIYLIGQFNFSTETLGIIFTIMLLPYIILEYPLGKIADKYTGEKEFLIVGFLIMAIPTALIPYFSSTSILMWAGLLLITRVGGAMVESMTAVYFFKKVGSKNAELATIFRDTRPIAYLIGPLAGGALVIKYGITSIFPTVGAIMLLGALLSTRLKDTR